LVLGAACFATALGACHEPSAASSNAPSNSAPRSVSVGDASPAGGAASAASGSASEAVAGAAPRSDSSANGPSVSSSGSPAAPSPASTIPAGDTGASPKGETSESLLDTGGKPLPQTDQRPSTTSAAFRQRIDAVAAAIISGDAEPALASFFPVVAYQQVKDVAKPERDYKFRLLANFKRDVLEYHHALGAEAAQATFTGISVSDKDAKWMEPGSEGNKLGYFRVLRSHLHFTLPAGRSRDFELTSLISWRGEWYVVHLHGFK
jgi:hypothetical protein